jgi:hypothetical protein
MPPQSAFASPKTALQNKKRGEAHLSHAASKRRAAGKFSAEA